MTYTEAVRNGFSGTAEDFGAALAELGKHTVYVAKSDRIGADSFDLAVSYDIAEVRQALDMDFYHMTAAERKNSQLYIEGYSVDILDGETAKEAYSRAIDEDIQPSFYEEFKPED